MSKREYHRSEPQDGRLEEENAAEKNQSILYVADGVIHKIGPFNSNDDVINAAVDAQEEGEYDIWEQHVYILHEDRLIELAASDLVSTRMDKR